MEDPKFISQRVAALLRERQRSECEASMELGMNKGYVQSIVSGRALPSMKQLYNIADYFGLSLADFFNAGDPPAVQQARELLREMDERDVRLLLPLLRRMAGGEAPGGANTKEGAVP